MFFTFPEDARWNAERQAVEFGVEIGEYSGVVRGAARVPTLLSERPTPERVWKRTTSRGPGSRRGSAQVAPAAVDRRWECRDQRAGFAREVRCSGSLVGRRPRVFLAFNIGSFVKDD